MAIRGASALRTLALVGGVAILAALLVTSSRELARGRIEANERAHLLASLQSVLDPRLRGRGLEPVHLTARDPDLLGSRNPVDVFVLLRSGRPEAAIFATVAPDGYSGPIKLLVGVSWQGTVTGVRVLDERETPGLGDRIEIEKSNWIRQFDGTRLGAPPLGEWAVRKDGGAFDALTGATVTPRAVIGAVTSTLLYFARHRDELLAAATRSGAKARGR